MARAKAVLLATGGAGHVYRDTTNPSVATGDGIAMAYRGGARVADLEFVQFHPTALMLPGEPRFLLSEALRGEGARLLNAEGESFMSRYDPAGDMAPRDRVARAIVRETQRTGAVYLSMEHLDPAFVHSRFPLISDACKRVGLDLARDRIPVGPAAHYVMGGVQTDIDGRTSIPGLYAAGEVACTGVHGANRLASNSLLEGLVFGARAGCAMRGDQRGEWPMEASRVIEFDAARHRRLESTEDCGGRVSVQEVQDLMWRQVGLFRDREGLTRALAILDPAWRAIDARIAGGEPLDAAAWREASILTVGRLDCARGFAPRGEPGRPLPLRFPETRRYTLETTGFRDPGRRGLRGATTGRMHSSFVGPGLQTRPAWSQAGFEEWRSRPTARKRRRTARVR